MLDSASTHAMIAVKDLSRAKEFYSGKLGLTAADELPAGAVRYEAQGGTWFLVYQSENVFEKRLGVPAGRFAVRS